jgi:hypothetical protein
MPITTWKIMLRRAGQAGYHYVSTHKKGWAPSVGEQVQFIVEGKTVKLTIAETFKDRSTKEGIDVFTVRVDEIKPFSNDRNMVERPAITWRSWVVLISELSSDVRPHSGRPVRHN